ncbi:DUF2520 domain-containing protein [Flavobacteriaceae bacterium]|nr:DUF2520 domain-containing protein [Flavobacteriaceae bacterium]
MIKICLLGFGNLGQHVAAHLNAAEGLDLVQIYSPSQKETSFEGVPLINDLKQLKVADLYIAAISDDAIANLSQNLPDDIFLVHTSGTVGMDVLSKQSKRGVFYPLQSFSKNHEVGFDQIPICLESNDAETMLVLEKVAHKLSKKVVQIDSAQRLELHFGAVLVNNFTNHLYALSQKHLKNKGMAFDLLHPLIEETTRKAMSIGADAAQTGPAKRGDFKTIERHMSLIEDQKLKEIYNLLSDSIREHSKSK